MRILKIHNRYRNAGGEDESVAASLALLRDKGHEVRLLEADNRNISGGLRLLRIGLEATYSFPARRRVAAALAEFRPDVVHVHNFFPLFSPAVYDACWRAGVPVVQTLHNYRLICPNGLLFRNSRFCTDCVGRRLLWPGVWHACYRDSHLASAAVANLIGVHRLLGTWRRKVALFIALTEFQRDQMVAGGLPAAKIVVKPNFVYPDFGVGPGGREYALYVGRLSPEKGIHVLLEAWQQLRVPLQLRVVGDGPLRAELQRVAAQDPRIQWLGFQSLPEVCRLMRQSFAVLLPSICPETFGRTIVEAYASGVPAITSDLGGQASLVKDGVTGRLFRTGTTTDLVRVITSLFHDTGAWDAMRRAARAEFETHFTADQNYQQMMAVYQQAIGPAAKRGGAGPPGPRC
jgi:glycosyltransferase involved in cell wall biosynthesis